MRSFLFGTWDEIFKIQFVSSPYAIAEKSAQSLQYSF